MCSVDCLKLSEIAPNFGRFCVFSQTLVVPVRHTERFREVTLLGPKMN